MFCVHHEKTLFILLLLSEVFYKCLLGPVVYSVVQFFYFLVIFCLIILFIIESGVLKLPTITVEIVCFSFNSVWFCFMYFNCYIFLILSLLNWSSLVSPFTLVTDSLAALLSLLNEWLQSSFYFPTFRMLLLSWLFLLSLSLWVYDL